MKYFRNFSYLVEKSTSSIIKKLFPDKTAITYYDKEEIEKKLAEIWQAKKSIETLDIDEVNCGLFQVRTKFAKETLVNRAIEILN